MYQLPGDFLLTYDPSYVERHSDSSDFEDFILPVVASKSGNHCLLKQKKKKKRKQSNGFINEQILANLYTDYKRNDDVREGYMWETETVHTSKTFSKKELKEACKNVTTKNLNRGDEVEAIQSKMSLFRHKIIPCLSSMFGRSNNTTKHMMIIKEKQPENKSADSGCQVECRRRRKHSRGQCYAIQPVYTVEGNLHGLSVPFEETKLTKPAHKIDRNCKDQYSNTSLSLTSSSGREARDKLARRKFKERLHTELKKEYVKHRNEKQRTRNQEQQCTSKPSKGSYQVYQQTTRSVCTTPTDSCSRLPSTASGFWDYICEKLNRKCPIQPIELQQYGCTCSGPTTDPACSPDNCTVLQAAKARPDGVGCCNRQQPPPSNDNSCSCSTSPAQEFIGKCYNPTSGLGQGAAPQPAPLPAKTNAPPYQYANKKSTASEKVECQCYPEKGKQSSIAPLSKSPVSPGSSQPSVSKKPCQESHNAVTNALASKYNGEILCIHNPPCVLINGCLNLPPPKEAPPVSLWPVTQGKRSSFYHLYRRKRSKQKDKERKNCEQACQYHAPYVEVQQCQTSHYKDEKITQSLCNHNPPCELVRSCYRDKYDPKLQNSCIHVPICDKPIKSSFDKHKQSPTRSLDRSPRNEEISMCIKNYTVMAATGTVGTQVKPKTKLCRHEPPCPRIPKCLGHVLDSYMSMQGVPMCVHEPACETVPTCYKKSPKEMVSVCSQYPNGCRVV